MLVVWPQGVEIALQAGANVNAASREGYTPLHLASFIGNVEIATMLLDAGATLTAPSVRASSPLGIAAQQGPSSKAVLELLLSRGACAHTRGYRQRNALEMALITHADPGILEVLVTAGKANPSAPNPYANNFTPLHLAARSLNRDATGVLLRAGADPNVRANQGITPAMMCFIPGSWSDEGGGEEKRVDVFQVLCAAGADVNAAMTGRGLTVLHLAIASCHEEGTVDSILSSPGVDPAVNVNLTLTSNKNTMMHVSARQGWVTAVRRLAAAGADLEARNKERFTPLHLAVIKQQVDTVKALLEAGADPFHLAPDIFPSLVSWRARRGMRAAQAFLNGPAPVPLGAANALLAELCATEPQSSAVDTAVAVTQDLAVVEAFVAMGALPSAEALALGEQCVPILRAAVEKSPWTPELHKKLPPAFKTATIAVLQGLKRAAKDPLGEPLPMSEDVLSVILTHSMYPLSDWADAEWLAAQRVRHPNTLRRPGQEQADGGQDGDNGGEPQQVDMAMAAGGAVLQAMPDFVDHLLNVMQQEILGHAHGGEDEDQNGEDEEDGNEGAPGPHGGPGPFHLPLGFMFQAPMGLGMGMAMLPPGVAGAAGMLGPGMAFGPGLPVPPGLMAGMGGMGGGGGGPPGMHAPMQMMQALVGNAIEAAMEGGDDVEGDDGEGDDGPPPLMDEDEAGVHVMNFHVHINLDELLNMPAQHPQAQGHAMAAAGAAVAAAAMAEALGQPPHAQGHGHGHGHLQHNPHAHVPPHAAPHAPPPQAPPAALHTNNGVPAPVPAAAAGVAQQGPRTRSRTQTINNNEAQEEDDEAGPSRPTKRRRVGSSPTRALPRGQQPDDGPNDGEAGGSGLSRKRTRGGGR